MSKQRRMSLGGTLDYSHGYCARFVELDRLIARQKALGLDDDKITITTPKTPRERMQPADERPVTPQQHQRILELRAEHYRQEEIAVQVGCQLRQVSTVFKQADRQESKQATDLRAKEGIAPVPRRRRSDSAEAEIMVEHEGETRSALDWALNVIGVEPFDVREFLAQAKTPEAAVREALRKRQKEGRAA